MAPRILGTPAADLAEWAGLGSLITSADVGTPVSIGEKPLPVMAGEDVHVSDLEKLVPPKAPSKTAEPT